MAPHAEPTTTNGSANQQAPASPTYKSFTHLQSYPVINDLTTTLTSHPLGRRTIDLSHSAFSTFIAPLSPYLSKAYPYVNAADDFADSTLVKVETRFPIIKEPSENIKSKVVDGITYPQRLAAEVIVRGQDFAKEKKEYVFHVYEDECAKMPENSDGYSKKARAGVATGFVVSSELMSAISHYLSSKRPTNERK